MQLHHQILSFVLYKTGQAVTVDQLLSESLNTDLGSALTNDLMNVDFDILGSSPSEVMSDVIEPAEPAKNSDKILRRLNKLFKKMVSHHQENLVIGFQRGLTGNDMPMLEDYGCWCYFEQSKGKGNPVDVFDQACKVLQEGYSCLKIDQEIEMQNSISSLNTMVSGKTFETCDVFNTEYISVNKFGVVSDESADFYSDCLKVNNFEPCASKLCTIEGNFITTVLTELFSNGNQPNSFMFGHQIKGTLGEKFFRFFKFGMEFPWNLS